MDKEPAGFDTEHNISRVISEEPEYINEKLATDLEMIEGSKKKSEGNFKKSKKKSDRYSCRYKDFDAFLKQIEETIRSGHYQLSLMRSKYAELDTYIETVVATLGERETISDKHLVEEMIMDEKCSSPLPLPSNEVIFSNEGLQVVKNYIDKVLESAEHNYPVFPIPKHKVAIGDGITLGPRPYQINTCSSNELYENCIVAKAMSQLESSTLSLARRNQNFQTSSEYYGDEHVTIFIDELYANVKSQVDYSDFRGLEKEMREVGRCGFPVSLVPTSERIKETYGDITKDSSQSQCAALPSLVLFCAAIKEMEDSKLEQVKENKLLLWRDAINSALNLGFKVDFAKEQLKKIGRAYLGLKLKARDEEIEEKEEEQRCKVRQECLREAEYFQDRPLTTGLFL